MNVEESGVPLRDDLPQGGATDGRWRSFQPDSDALEAGGYASVSECWVLFQPDGYPARIYNEYLRARFTGDWIPRFPGREAPPAANEWSEKTSKGAADKLSNWCNWLLATGYDWRTITYDELLLYQKDMVRGLWAKSKPFEFSGGATPVPLSNNIANARTDEATFFLL